LVSVIIPNYNHGAFLKRRIDSVLSQTYQDFEVIILDDCSDDNSRQIIEQYREHPKVKAIVYNSINSGSPFKQWQTGIELSKGKYVWIAESDDYSESNFLQIAVDRLLTDESSLFFCQSYDIDESGKVNGDFLSNMKSIAGLDWDHQFKMQGNEFISKALQYRNLIVNASSVVFRKPEFDLKKIIKYKNCGDWFFWVILLNQTFATVSYSPLKMNYFRTHLKTTRFVDSKYKYVRNVVEELSIKYYLYKLRLITKETFKLYFLEYIDSLIPYFKIYKIICKQLNLPQIFIVAFVKRRIQLRLQKMNTKFLG
jgi:glycosyltransferase involved in cell wall biosynthesis